MQTSKKRIVVSLLSLMMILGTFVPAFAGGARQTLTSTPVTLKVHKLKYDNDTAKGTITNDGKEKTNPAGVEAYDPTVYGKVAFTLYKLNKSLVETELKKGGNTQELAKTIEGALDTYKTAEVAKDSEITTKGEPATIDVSVGDTNGEYYLLVESTSPKTVVEKSEPMLLKLPLADPDGSGIQSTTHIYPKNKVDESKRTLEFEKVAAFGDKTAKFEGAEFNLYKGEPGVGTKVQKDGNDVIIKSNAEGKIKVEELTVGKYYLVEIPSDKVDAVDGTADKAKSYLISLDAQNDANNKFVFEMKADGTMTSPDDKVIKNYGKPFANKSIISTNKSIGFGDKLKYKIDVNLPKPLNQKNKYVIVDTLDDKLDLDLTSVKVYVGTDTKAIGEDGGPTGFTLNKDALIVKDSSSNKYTITLNKDSLGIGETGAPTATTYRVEYEVSLKKDAALTGVTELTNTIDPTYTDDNGKDYPHNPDKPVDPENPDKDIPEDKKPEDNVVTKSYNKSFTKVDSGIFGSKVAKRELEGAEFILGKTEGEKTLYRVENADTKYTWSEDETSATKYKSGSDGKVTVEGLAKENAEGTDIEYFIKEVKAPAGYTMPAKEKDRVHKFNFTTEGDIATAPEIVNNKNVDAPMTGYEKSTLVLGGLTVIFAVSMVLNRKKKATEVK